MTSLEAYTSRTLQEWPPPEGFSTEDARSRLPDLPYVWTDGSLVREEVSGCCSGGAGVYAHVSGSASLHRSWGHLDLLPVDADTGVECCRLFSCVLGPLQSVQRAEIWGVILALQISKPVHLGVDNHHVVRHVGRIMAGKEPDRPFELLTDGGLLLLVQTLVVKRSLGTCAISKVKGHADDDMVCRGRVRLLDKTGNDRADESADLGRSRVLAAVTDSRRHLVPACRYWYPIRCDLHRLFIAMTMAAVNDDGVGCTAPYPLVWSVGFLPKRRRCY